MWYGGGHSGCGGAGGGRGVYYGVPRGAFLCLLPLFKSLTRGGMPLLALVVPWAGAFPSR